MLNGCVENFEAKIVENSERAKKLYRYVSDVARRVSEATTTCRSMSDLFSTQLEVQRQKLKENCEKLMFLDPVNHGKKSLELLWRKVYYDTVAVGKKFHESDNNYDSYLFTHIVSGIGHFHHFITRIQAKTLIQAKELDYPLLHDDEEKEETNIVLPEEVQFGKAVLHSCLIYLGDLSRYQGEIFHTFDHSIAARYYLQAAHIDMSSGMPFNQLGNLYMDKNFNLDSACYYIHCLSCDSPFDGAMGNLTKLFEKNNQFCEALNEAETLTQTEHIQSTVSNFLSLIEIWYQSKNDTNIPQRCNTIAQEMKIAMDFAMTPVPDINKNYTEHSQALEEENVNPSFLNGNLVHKIVQICLFTMAKMIETDEQKAFACKAFTLALFLQLLQKLLKQLESFGLKNLAYKYKPKGKVMETEPEAEPENVEEQHEDVEEPDPVTSDTEVVNGTDADDKTDLKGEVSDEDAKKLQNGEVKTSGKKVMSKRRRRRRVASSESSELSDDVDTESSEVATEESCSDDESDSTYKSEDDSKSDGTMSDHSDAEEASEKVNGNNIPSTAATQDINHNKNDVTFDAQIFTNTAKHPENKKSLNEDEIKNFLLGDNFLPSIKLLQDWILTEKDLIISCGESGESLFQCIVDLLNIFSFYFSSKSNEEIVGCKVLEYAKNISKNLKLEFKTIPLPEDVNLRGTNICKFDKDAAEWQILNKYSPSVYEENIIRVLNFIDFGNQIAKIVPRIRFNRSLKIFYFKKTSRPRVKVNTKINHKRSREWHNSKKQHAEVEPEADAGDGGSGGLLRRLGRLWLTARVRELERSHGASAPAPALLALDGAALAAHLKRVKHLMRTRNFILLVPTVVLQELDELKRERSTARDAIRWLEVQLKSGSRFLRAQRPGQSKPLPLLKYPRKAPPQVQNFIQILEFCYHFVGDEKQPQGGNGDPDSSLHGKSAPLLILLVGNEPGKDEEQYKEFSLRGAASSAGISVEYIGDFYAKWRQTTRKAGKKR